MMGQVQSGEDEEQNVRRDVADSELSNSVSNNNNNKSQEKRTKTQTNIGGKSADSSIDAAHQTHLESSQCKANLLDQVWKLTDVIASKTRHLGNRKGHESFTNSQAHQHPNQRQQSQIEQVRKLSNVSYRNIQLLSLKPRSERDLYVDDLRTRRRSSLINLILGAPASGPRFSDDLCSLNSQISDCTFGIEFFPEISHYASVSSLRLDSIEDGIGAQSGGAAAAAERVPDGGNCVASAFKIDTLAGRTASVSSKNQKRRRSSLDSLNGGQPPGNISNNPSGANSCATSGSAQRAKDKNKKPPSSQADAGAQHDEDNLAIDDETRAAQKDRQLKFSSGLTSTLASIDLKSSFEQNDKTRSLAPTPPSGQVQRPPLRKSNQTIFEMVTEEHTPCCDYNNNNNNNNKYNYQARVRCNQGDRSRVAGPMRRTSSELSLYSNISSSSSDNVRCCSQHIKQSRHLKNNSNGREASRDSISTAGLGSAKPYDSVRETKLIIMLQVCLPFILAGFGNMGAGLVLNKVAHWKAFKEIPIFFVLLPPFIGMKGNIEMTLASRLSTLSNLKLLDTKYQWQRAYLSNLVLVLSQGIGLAIFASAVSILCELGLTGAIVKHNTSTHLNPWQVIEISILVVISGAIATSVLLLMTSSFIMTASVGLAKLIKVNPDNLSTLIAALYGDVSCVVIYGLMAEWMYELRVQNHKGIPLGIIGVTLTIWPVLVYVAYRFKETKSIAIVSLPPLIASILISIGSGAFLSMFVDRFKLIAMYQPVVNGFGANLIAVQASRVSTWLWCSALRRISISNRSVADQTKLFGSLASFQKPDLIKANREQDTSDTPKLSSLGWISKCFRTLLWSFFNRSPNSTAAKLLLIMLIPAHTIYFVVIWCLAPNGTVSLTWYFYGMYIGLCLFQVFILLSLCEPLMTFLMNRHLDPDIFGISILMALADLTGTICLVVAFTVLEKLGDSNAS